MEYNRMMEKALADTFGTDLIVSDVDLMVFAEDEIRMSHYESKDNRANRRRKTALAKKHLQKKAKYAADEILVTGKVKNTGFASYEKGAKAWSRKVRHEKPKFDGRLTPYEFVNSLSKDWEAVYFERKEEDWILVTVEYPMDDYSYPVMHRVETSEWWYTTADLFLDHDMVFEADNTPSIQYQSEPISEAISDKVLDAWYWYNYSVTMEAETALLKIKKSIGDVENLNKILNNEKLAKIVENLQANWSDKF